jgi:hypothetical protein
MSHTDGIPVSPDAKGRGRGHWIPEIVIDEIKGCLVVQKINLAPSAEPGGPWMMI